MKARWCFSQSLPFLMLLSFLCALEMWDTKCSSGTVICFSVQLGKGKPTSLFSAETYGRVAKKAPALRKIFSLQIFRRCWSPGFFTNHRVTSGMSPNLPDSWFSILQNGNSGTPSIILLWRVGELTHTWWPYLFLRLCLFIEREGKLGRKRGRKTLVGCFLHTPQQGTRPATQARALTGTWTGPFALQDAARPNEARRPGSCGALIYAWYTCQDIFAVHVIL